jgi:hypothetical protein
MGGALKLIHDAFRRELGLIRAEVATAGPRVGAQLRVNCLTLCRGLHGHHTKEDTALFTGIGRQRPDLAPVLQRLRAEHETIAAVLADLQQTLGDTDLDAVTLQVEVDRLVAELEAHLDYEEAELIPVLDDAVDGRPAKGG